MNTKLDGLVIARVSTVSFFIETQLRSQINEMLISGAKVFIISSEKKLSISIEGAEYESIRIERKISIFRDIISIINLTFFFKRNKICIIHSTTPKAGLVCAIAGFLAGVPIRLHTYTGQVWINNDNIKSSILKLADKVIYFLNTCCYADSNSQAEFLKREKIVDDKIRVIGHGSLAGIDTNRFNDRRYTNSEINHLKSLIGIPLDDKVLIFVGRINWDKGIRELICAFDILQKTHNISLLIVGPSEIDIDSFINNLSLLDKSKIFFTGFTKEPEKYLAISDLFILPSYREGFGTSIIEAAAMGIPAIGSNIYGLCDSIENGKSGFLVPVRDVQSLCQAIDIILSDNYLMRKMAVYAKRRARLKFAAPVVNSILMDHYLFFSNSIDYK